MLSSVTLDESLVIIEFNDAFCFNILPAKMALGCSILTLFDKYEHEGLREFFSQCVSQTESSHNISDKIISTVSNHPNGLPVRMMYNCVVTYSSGKFYMVLSPSTTNVAQAEADELKDFFNKAPIALHWLSDEGKVLWANDRELEVLGYTREEYIGENIMDFCPDSKGDVLEIFKQLGSGNTIRDVPVRFRTKTGGVRDLLIDSNVNYKNDGSFNHTRCFIRDDTGRKIREARAEVLLNEAQKNAEDKSRFIAKIMHEIKTPIHVLSMADESDDRQIRQKQVSLLKRLVSNVTIVMQFDEGYKPVMTFIECDIISFFEDYSSPILENREVTTLVEAQAKSTRRFIVDTKKLTMVVDELLLYCDGLNNCEDLCLKVSFNPDPNECIVEVSYRGIVLDVSSVHRVFHRYWLDSTESDYGLLKTDMPGLNLGLNIAFNLVECLGSNLVVESTEEKTCFRFTLNSKVQSIESDESLSISNEKQQPNRLGVFSSSSKHILVVEDSKMCQKMLTKFLKKLGHTFQIADNGAIAVDMVTTLDSVIYDLILMDIRMPVMDGIEATEKIREYLDLNQMHLPIVALTAECDLDTLRKNGFVDILTKPTSMSDITASIELHTKLR